MLLSDRDLGRVIRSGELKLYPFHENLIQPSSIDVRLDNRFRVFNNHLHEVVDPLSPPENLTELVETEKFILHPGSFILGSTLEKVTMGHQHAARLEGKSSLGRLGLVVHSTAGFIDPGFSGTITLELSNVSGLPILLTSGMKIGQLCLFRMTSPCIVPYGDSRLGSKYQNQVGPTQSRSTIFSQ